MTNQQVALLAAVALHCAGRIGAGTLTSHADKFALWLEAQEQD